MFLVQKYSSNKYGDSNVINVILLYIIITKNYYKNVYIKHVLQPISFTYFTVFLKLSRDIKNLPYKFSDLVALLKSKVINSREHLYFQTRSLTSTYSCPKIIDTVKTYWILLKTTSAINRQTIGNISPIKLEWTC